MNEDKKNEWQMPEIKERGLNRHLWTVFHRENFKLGRDTDIGAFTLIDATHGVVIEEGVKIGSHCSIYSRTDIDSKAGKVALKKNSSVGSHCVVMPGITIGENSIVGAMSFVNRDIPPNEVWAGCPARFLKKR